MSRLLRLTFHTKLQVHHAQLYIFVWCGDYTLAVCLTLVWQRLIFLSFSKILLNFQPGYKEKKDWIQKNIWILKNFGLSKIKWFFIPYPSQFRLREEAFFLFAFQVLDLRQKILTKWKFVNIFPNILDINGNTID